MITPTECPLDIRVLCACAEATARAFWRRRIAWALLLAMSAVYFGSYFYRIAVPGTIFDELQRDFATTAGAVAALGAIFLYIYGGMQLVTGILADRFGGLRVMMAGGILLTLGGICFPLTHSLILLYVFRGLTALGASLIFISLVKELDRLFEARHFAMILSVALFIGYSGGLFGTLPFERAVANFGWRVSLLGFGIFCGGALIVTATLFKITEPALDRERTQARLLLAAILQNRDSLPVILSGAINFGIYFLIQATVGKKMLTDCCGLTSAQAAAVTFFMMLTSMSCTSLSGFISRLMGNRRPPLLRGCTLLMLGATGVMIVALSGAPNPAWVTAAFILAGAASAASPLFCVAMKELNPPTAAGTAIGLINGACYLVIAIGINLSGWALDHFADAARHTATAVIYPPAAYRTILIGCLGLAVISCVSALFIRETRGTCVYQE